MTIKHVIWDWNGTLLDDVDITVQSTINWLKTLGCEVTPETVRMTSSRDFRQSYSQLLNRPVTDAELAEAFNTYIALYEPAKRSLPLTNDALTAIDALAGRGISQSLLSMAPHEELIELADIHGLTDRFHAIHGYTGGSHSKLENLKEHLKELKVVAEHVALIGDALDDYQVSQAAGITPILYGKGMYAAERLEKTGATVVHSLLDAVEALP